MKTAEEKRASHAVPDWSALNEPKRSWIYRLIRWFVWLFSPKYSIAGAENLPEGPCIIVGNHSHMYGPIAAELYTPGKHVTWCAGQMMKKEEAAAYAYQDFWSGKPRGTRWFFKLLSHLIVPLSVLIFNSAHTVPVYHDTRLISTYRDSIEALHSGAKVVIFPECLREHNQIVHAFQDKFVDLARFYHKKTGEALRFVPLYLAPALKTMFYGKPVAFRPELPITEERARICAEMAEAITAIAEAQPIHRVVPYPNVSRRQYPMSRTAEGAKHEKTSL